MVVKLAERQAREQDQAAEPAGGSGRPAGPFGSELGLSLIEINESNAHRFDVPPGMTGLLVQRVEPLSAAHDAGIERGNIVLEINRQPIHSDAARPGDVLAVYLFIPEIEQRNIRTIRLEPR
jgi:serine protease Do